MPKTDPLFKGWPLCDECQRPITNPEEASLFPGSTPEAVWRWGHDDCFTDEDPDYYISGERFDTIGKALDWTLHLQGKAWFNPVSWEVTVRRFWNVPNA